jgi:NitT/TauT family transport system substrate-binding protein
MIKTTTFAILLALSLFRPSVASELPGARIKPTLIPVRMGIPLFSASYMPYLLAKDRGFYQEEGITVEFILMNTSVAMAATISGSIEFNGVPGTTIGAAMQGAPVKLVLTLSRTPKYWIFAAPEIRSVAELSGQTLGVGTRGSAPHIYTLLILDKLGLTGKVNVLPMAGTAARAVVTSMLTGKLVAGYASDSTYFELKESRFRDLLFYGDHVQDVSAGVGTSHKIIATRPEIVQGFVNASYRGLIFFRQYRRESIQTMVRYMKMDEDKASRTYDLVINTFGGDGAMPYDSVKRVLQARKDILNLDDPVPAREVLFDAQFVAKLPKGRGNNP